MKTTRTYLILLLTALLFLGSCTVYTEASLGKKSKPKLCNLPSDKHFKLKGAGL